MTGRVISAYHRVAEAAALQLRTAEIEEFLACFLIGKVSDRVGVKRHVHVRQNIEVCGIANGIKVSRSLTEKNIRPKGRHDLVGVEYDETTMRLSASGID